MQFDKVCNILSFAERRGVVPRRSLQQHCVSLHAIISQQKDIVNQTENNRMDSTIFWAWNEEKESVQHVPFLFWKCFL